MEEKKLGIDVRKVVQIGGDCAGVVLPKEYLESNGVKKGDPVEVVFDDLVQIRPISEGEIERKLEGSVDG